MTAAEEKTSPTRLEPLQGLESPFLNSELFAGQGAEEWQAHLGALEAEGGFLSTFEQPWAQPSLGETERAEGSGNEFVSPDQFVSTDEFEFEDVGVINGDNRVRVKDTTGVPWRWICKIDVADSKGRPAGSGTGVLVSNKHVLTAAHVVYDAYKNMQQYTVTVIPALNDLDEPFDRYSLASKPKIRQEYDPSADDNFDWDYALLTLSTAVGEKGFKALTDKPLCYWASPQCGANTMLARLDPRTLNGKAAYTAGYPGGKGGRQLWCAAGILHSANERRRTMFTTADTTRGQSGSPVWVVDNKRQCLVGIAAGAGTGSNRVVRVTRELVRQLRAWISEGGETPAMVETEEALEPPVLLLPQPEVAPPSYQEAEPFPRSEAEEHEPSAAEWSTEIRGGQPEAFSGVAYQEGETQVLDERPLEERFDILEHDAPSASTRVVAVGQRIELDLNDIAFAEGAEAIRWTIPGTRVRAYDGNARDSKLIKLTDADLQQPKIVFYWVDAGDGRVVRARFRTESGGWGQVVHAFNVKGPTVNSFTPKTGVTRIEKDHGLIGMRFGKQLVAPGVAWHWKVTMPSTQAGFIKDVQTVLNDRSKVLRLEPGGKETRTLVWRHPKKTDPHVQLDGSSDGQAAYTDGLSDSKIEAGGTSTSGDRGIEDSPHTELPPLGKTVAVNDQFTYYLMFKPATAKGGDAIWVPIAKAKWFWKASANNHGGNWVVSSGKMTPSIDKTTLEFPQYESNAAENEWQELSAGASKEEYAPDGDVGIQRHAGELDETGESDEFAGQLFEAEEYVEPVTEGLVPAVSKSDLRKRIDEYFDFANAEYAFPNGSKVKARSQFHIATVGSPEQDAERIEKLFGKHFGTKFSSPLHTIIRCAAYGRARPDEIKVITQHLIDAGELEAVRDENPGSSDKQLVRALQTKFNIGIDCAGYVQLAFIYAFTGEHDDARCNLGSSKPRENLGLKAKRSDENLAALPAKHFTEVGFLNGQTGDLLVLAWRKGERDWHTVIIVDHLVADDVHTFVVDASWGFLYGSDAAGVARRKLVFDTSTGNWWDVHPIDGTKVNENSTGPYKGHPIKGMYRAKEK
ncbi:MAG TPA: trypsin-like peptidase domain-containing protein [Candidatus Dormibacteraeota bacterium]